MVKNQTKWTNGTVRTLKFNAILIQGGGTGGAIAPPSFGDLYSKFWEILGISFFAIYCSPPMKN